MEPEELLYGCLLLFRLGAQLDHLVLATRGEGYRPGRCRHSSILGLLVEKSRSQSLPRFGRQVLVDGFEHVGLPLPLSTDMTNSPGNKSFAGPADLVRGRVSGSKWTGGGLSLVRPGPPQGLLVPKLLHLDVEELALDVTELAVTAGTVGGCCSRNTSGDNLLKVNVRKFPLGLFPILVSVTEGLVTGGTNFSVLLLANI